MLSSEAKIGRRVDPKEKIMQRSIGFYMRQHLFMAKYPEFKPDKYCREAIDKQIAMIDPKYLKGGEKDEID